jgi:hypothetical protein
MTAAREASEALLPTTAAEAAAVEAGLVLLDAHWGRAPDGALVDRCWTGYGLAQLAGSWVPGRYVPTEGARQAAANEWAVAEEWGDAHDWRQASYRLSGMATMAAYSARWADQNYLNECANAAWVRIGDQAAVT